MENDSIKIIKGKHVKSGFEEVHGKNIEIRFNISQKYWRIATSPDYSNVEELANLNCIDDSASYYFTVFLER